MCSLAGNLFPLLQRAHPPTQRGLRRFNLDARCASTMLAALASEGVQLCLDASIHLRRLQCISAGSRDKKRRYQTIQSIRTPHAYSRVGRGLVKAHAVSTERRFSSNMQRRHDGSTSWIDSPAYQFASNSIFLFMCWSAMLYLALALCTRLTYGLAGS